MALDMKYGQIDIPGIPEDEPVFILRAKDSLSELAISEYQSLYVKFKNHEKDFPENADIETLRQANDFLNRLRAVRRVFVEWQASHADSVKVPD